MFNKDLLFYIDFTSLLDNVHYYNGSQFYVYHEIHDLGN